MKFFLKTDLAVAVLIYSAEFPYQTRIRIEDRTFAFIGIDGTPAALR